MENKANISTFDMTSNPIEADDQNLRRESPLRSQSYNSDIKIERSSSTVSSSKIKAYRDNIVVKQSQTLDEESE